MVDNTASWAGHPGDSTSPPCSPGRRAADPQNRCSKRPRLVLPSPTPDGDTPPTLANRLAELPTRPLDHFLSILANEAGGSSIRGTCSWLRSRFDRCATRLVLRGPNPSSRMLHIVGSSPCVSSITLHTSVDRLHWTEVLAAGGLALAQRLQQLTLSRRQDVEDLTPLGACSSLRHLDLSGCSNVKDLGPLAACAGLQHLSLRNCYEVEHLGPLASCMGLQHLDLRRCTNVTQLDALARCTNLQHLDLNSCDEVQDLRPLAACVKLQHLDLSGCDELQHLLPLAACIALVHLDLSSCEKVRDLGPLASCVGLLHLDVSGCDKLRDLHPLASCVALRHLDLNSCSRVQDLSPLAACAALQYLNLRGCSRVASLQPLARCVGLLELNISHCGGAGSLRPLDACVALQHLEMDGGAGAVEAPPPDLPTPSSMRARSYDSAKRLRPAPSDDRKRPGSSACDSMDDDDGGGGSSPQASSADLGASSCGSMGGLRLHAEPQHPPYLCSYATAVDERMAPCSISTSKLQHLDSASSESMEYLRPLASCLRLQHIGVLVPSGAGHGCVWTTCELA